MTWLWRIFFSASLAAFACAATVNGRVVLQDSQEKAVQRGLDYSGVVVWLEPSAGKAPHQPPTLHATMLQKNKRFTPHILAIQAGTVVNFPNQDPIFHNAFSNYSGQIFDVGLYKPGSTRSVPFKRPGVVRVFCNIHANMSAVIVVVDTPWFATSAQDGSFRIEDVPPGDYKLQVFHERATPAQLATASKTITVGETGVALSPVTISESGFLPAPHLNKHGKPYEPDTDRYKVLR
jgi:plastocyanin